MIDFSIHPLAALLATAAPVIAAQGPITIQPDGLAGNDQFARSMATACDVLVVGAPFVDESASKANTGEVYVYARRDQQWELIQVLINPDADGTTAEARFGFDVDVSCGDSGDFIVVGAPQANGAHPLNGSAYVFVRMPELDPPWVFEQELSTPPPAGPDSRNAVGAAVAIDFAVPAQSPNDEGVYEIVVGAPDFGAVGPPAIRGGAAFRYERFSGAWSLLQTIAPNDAESNAGDAFGAALDVRGDYLVVGSPSDHFGRFADDERGSAYLFRRLGPFSGWDELAHLLASGSTRNDKVRRGAAVAIGEHASSVFVLVGVPLATVSSQERAGAVDIYDVDPFLFGDVNEDAVLTPTIAGRRSEFGTSIETFAGSILVGAPDIVSSGDFPTGRAVLFDPLAPLEWNQATVLSTQSDPLAEDLGVSVALGAAGPVVGDPGYDFTRGGAFTFAAVFGDGFETRPTP